MLERVAERGKELRLITVGGGSAKGLGATGEAVLAHPVERLHQQGIVRLVAQTKRQSVDTRRRTGVIDTPGEGRVFDRVEDTLG